MGGGREVAGGEKPFCSRPLEKKKVILISRVERHSLLQQGKSEKWYNCEKCQVELTRKQEAQNRFVD